MKFKFFGAGGESIRNRKLIAVVFSALGILSLLNIYITSAFAAQGCRPGADCHYTSKGNSHAHKMQGR
jgi:hypothetical protein